ncbi:type 4a pilus biogenesis protein PilO [Campylobacter ureolyticus]|uniref:Pilus assembly protein, PilO n=1 Tax=Campylobacter ureolyticus TaxID=827 RepID=A0A6N2SSY2_9BACT
MKENYLDKIDNALLSKQQNEVQMINLGLAVVVLLFGYLLAFGPAQDYFDAKQSTLKQEDDNLKFVQAQNNYFDNKLRELSYITYNEKNWAKFLDFLTSAARENNIKVFSLESKNLKVVEKEVQPMLDVSVSMEGGFHNVLKYINSVEESEMVVDLNGMDIHSTSPNLIGGNIKISVWGMKYQ